MQICSSRNLGPAARTRGECNFRLNQGIHTCTCEFGCLHSVGDNSSELPRPIGSDRTPPAFCEGPIFLLSPIVLLFRSLQVRTGRKLKLVRVAGILAFPHCCLLGLPQTRPCCRQSPLEGLSQVGPADKDKPHEMNQKRGSQLPACIQPWQSSRFGINFVASSVRGQSSCPLNPLVWGSEPKAGRVMKGPP